MRVVKPSLHSATSIVLNMLIIKTITCSIIQGIFLALSIAHARAAGNETDKIVGGSPASSGEYLGYAIPSIQSGSRFLCGAYLIRNNILVTAAHCREAFEGFDVYIGGLQRLGEDAVETIATGDVCQHPGYSEKGLFSSPFANDIMLIRLQTPSNQPIKEYYTSSSAPLTGISIGFGLTSSNGAISNNLLEAEVSIQSNTVCSDLFEKDFDAGIMLCAGGGGKSTCNGDSGGPLLDQSSPSKIVGIVSYGENNQCGSLPSGYTRISAYDSWIRENTAKGEFVNCQKKKKSCFSALNTVEERGKGIITIDELQIGDYVKAGNDRFSRVYSFSHLDNSTEAIFLQIHTEQLDKPLEVSPDHIVYVSGGKAVRASDVRVGDRMHDVHVVSRITMVQRRGVYAPVTYSGNIVVSGVLASSYVSLLDHVSPGIQNRAAHYVTGVQRMICILSFSTCEQETYDAEEGLSYFIRPVVRLVQELSYSILVPLLIVTVPCLWLLFMSMEFFARSTPALLLMAFLIFTSSRGEKARQL